MIKVTSINLVFSDLSNAMSKTCRIDITLVGLCCSKTQGDLPDWGHAVQTEILDILYHTLFGVKYV